MTISDLQAEIERLGREWREASGTLTHGMNCPALTPTRDDDCRCGLRWRVYLQTEQEMHAAWRKRAEEAEAERDAAQAEAARLRMNVAIEDGVLRVAFASPAELMGDLYRLVKAAGNNWDEFVRVCRRDERKGEKGAA